MKLETMRLSIDKIRELSASDIAGLLHQRVEAGKAVRKAAQSLPRLEVEPEISPITRTIVRVTLTVRADFIWQDRFHGSAEPFWFWVVDDRHEQLVHQEYFILQKKQAGEAIKVAFIIPIFADPFPSQYFLHIYSDRWYFFHCCYRVLFLRSKCTFPSQQARQLKCHCSQLQEHCPP